MLAIYKKEMRAYFTSIVGYLFLAFFLALIGLYFYAQNLYSGSPNFGYALGGVMMFFILLVPMVTMRIMAGGNKQKTAKSRTEKISQAVLAPVGSNTAICEAKTEIITTTKVIIAANAWLSVSAEINSPIAMYAAPIRKKARMQA